MIRRIWLIATVAAFFVLQAPLCVLACVENTSSAQATPTASETSSGHPCHEPTPDSSPAGESSSHADCGCDFAPQGVISQPSDFGIAAPDLIFAPHARRLERAFTTLDPEPPAARDADLPPPDILLLKSTLIV